MTFRNLISQLNIFGQCRRYGISLWQCPEFLFLVMGIATMAAILIAYILGSRIIDDPLLVTLMILVLAILLLTIAFIITRSFERLAEANRLKTEFVGIVSHQLRSPLTNLRWALDFLISENHIPDDRKSSYFQILKENTDRMQELVNDLLMVSRVEEGRLPLQRQEFSFSEMVKDLVAEFTPFAQASHIELKVEGQENLPKVSSDPFRIRQVAANFLDNAIRYAWKESDLLSQRAQKIVIRFYRKNSTIHFEVEDNGVGIPKEDQKYIFQKFFRSSNIRKQDTHGTGLGLYIAKSIIEKAGGQIGFRSEENKGSTFWFTIPIS